MKRLQDNSKKIKQLSEAASHDGLLDKATVDAALDRMLKAVDEINRELDRLLDKAKS